MKGIEMVECLECGDKFDKDNAPMCEAYDDGETKCFDVRMCEGCAEYEADPDTGSDNLCARCQYEWEQEKRDREWDYRNA
jgi:hypothetical protein